MATYLDRILAAHRAAAAVDDRTVESVLARLPSAPAVRGFRAALQAVAAGELAVISEVKRASPSRGPLRPDLDPVALARSYRDGGAVCLSVLTDVEFFAGSPDDLRMARAASGLPVLRKDFTVSPLDVLDARMMGADAVLLIVAALDDGELADLYALARDVGLDALVEVHDEAELERALAVGADLVGVNQRDLVTFEVDVDRAVRLAEAMPDDVVAVAESGVGGPADAARLAEAGYHAVLVGEALVRHNDPAAAVAALRTAPAGCFRP